LSLGLCVKIGIATHVVLRLHVDGRYSATDLRVDGLNADFAASVIWKRPGEAITSVFPLCAA